MAKKTTNKWLSELEDEFSFVASNLPDLRKEILPTPSPSLNWATDVGGFIPTKIVTLVGPESGGKSLLAMLSIIEMQKKDKEGLAIWFDAEYAFEPHFFVKLGGDVNRLLIRKNNDPLSIFDWMTNELKMKLQDGMPLRIIVIDSIKAIKYPKDEKKKSTDQTRGGSGAPYLTTAFKWIIPIIYQYKLRCFLIQQVSMEVDPIKALINKWVIPDGQALKHASDVLIEVSRTENKAGKLIIGEQQKGHKVKMRVRKNRVGAPFREAVFTLHYDLGIINQHEEVFELGESLGVIYHPINEKTNRPHPSNWQFENTVAKGRDDMLEKIKADSKLQERIYQACLKPTDEQLKNRSKFLKETTSDELYDLTEEEKANPTMEDVASLADELQL